MNKREKTREKLRKKRKNFTYNEVMILLMAFANEIQGEPITRDFATYEVMDDFANRKLWFHKHEVDERD